VVEEAHHAHPTGECILICRDISMNTRALSQIQFVILTVVYTRTFFASNCSYPMSLRTVLLTQSVFMLYLFSKFYIKAYVKKSK
jgi:hypothetical protein